MEIEFHAIKNLFEVTRRDSSFGMRTGCGLHGRDSVPARDKRLFFTPMSRLTLGPTEPPTQNIPAVSLGSKAAGA
jgi:hypothetical protein